MATIERDGCEIHYELLGAGPPLALTPGGRSAGNDIRATALGLAEQHRVLLWDRRNTGSSHVWVGLQPEQLVWADDLAALLRHLELAPAYLAGASAGARVSYLTAIRHPDVAAGLVLWSVSGGPYASQNLGYQYHTPFINEAIRAGMDGVAATPFFRERIEANPANRERLLSIPPDEFVAALRAWNESFYPRPDMPVIAASAGELAHRPVPDPGVRGQRRLAPARSSGRGARPDRRRGAGAPPLDPRRMDAPLRRAGERIGHRSVPATRPDRDGVRGALRVGPFPVPLPVPLTSIDWPRLGACGHRQPPCAGITGAPDGRITYHGPPLRLSAWPVASPGAVSET